MIARVYDSLFSFSRTENITMFVNANKNFIFRVNPHSRLTNLDFLMRPELVEIRFKKSLKPTSVLVNGLKSTNISKT